MRANGEAAGDGGSQPKLLDRVRYAMRARQLSPRTEEAYVAWIRRYVLHYGKRHPRELTGDHLAGFLAHLANAHHVSASTQNQAASALLFLYREVLRVPVDVPGDVVRPRHPRTLPTVLSRAEVAAVLAEMSGQHRLIGSLLYGSGLRLRRTPATAPAGRRSRPRSPGRRPTRPASSRGSTSSRPPACRRIR